MGKGGGGKGGDAKGRSFYLFPGRLFGPPVSSATNGILRQVAVARGLSGTDELLVSLGKEQSGMSTQEAIDFMVEELGPKAYIEYVNTELSTPQQCKKSIQRYKKYVKSADEIMATASLNFLKKYCGYHGDEEK